MVKVTGALQKSTEIMKLSNSLIKLPQISQTMREMSMEMTKVRGCLITYCILTRTCYQSGIMEEMMEDTLEMDEDEEIEEEADAEIDKVLFELTSGKLGQAGAVGTEQPAVRSHAFRSSPVVTNSLSQKQDQQEDDETERTMEQYRQQLNGLLST